MSLRPSTVAEPLVAEPASVIARIPEAAIQDAWVRGLFDATAMKTTEGKPVEILARGRLNWDSGPDVTDARVVIGGLTWAGDIEIHRTSGDWEAHGHDADPAYDRVALHVVLSADRRTGTLRRADGSVLPELVLLPYLDRSLRSLLREFYIVPRRAPHCGHRWPEVAPDTVRPWVRHLGVERLRARADALGQAYGRRPDLDRLLVGRVFRALGYDANADAMEELARRAPREALRQLDGPDVLAVLLGVGGFLAPDLLDSDGDLNRRHAEIAPTLGLTAMPATSWRRGGRPANAPRTRIAQAAALLAPDGVLRADPAARLSDAVVQGADTLIDLLRAEPIVDAPRLGRPRAERIAADAVLPALLLEAEQRESPGLEVAVLDAYAALAPTEDRVTRPFEDAGFKARSALDAQGLHQLARAYCDEGRCAQCAIGQTLYPALARLD